MIISFLSIFHFPFLLSQFHHFPAAKNKAGARAKPPSGAQSSGAPAAPPSETGSRGSSIRRASSQAAKSPTPVTSPSETGAVSKGRRKSTIIPSVVVVPCNVKCPVLSFPRTNSPLSVVRSSSSSPSRGSFRPEDELRIEQSFAIACDQSVGFDMTDAGRSRAPYSSSSSSSPSDSSPSTPPLKPKAQLNLPSPSRPSSSPSSPRFFSLPRTCTIIFAWRLIFFDHHQ